MLVVEFLVGGVWVLLCHVWLILSILAVRRWFGDGNDVVAIGLGLAALLGFAWSIAVTPAVVSFTLAP